MDTRIKRTAAIAVMLLGTMAVSAQKEKKVEGEFQYWASPYMTALEARDEAIKFAKVEAIAKKFSKIVTSNSYMGMDKVDNEEHTMFSSLDECEVKGEWLYDLEPPTIVRWEPQEDYSALITVRVKGKAREIVSAPVKFESKILRNGTVDRAESTDFMDFDKFYMSFRSPENGYLAIYMLDDEGQAFRLLPYSNSDKPVFRVEHDKRYTFFTREDGGNGIQAHCRQPIEFNHIYTIFSPTEFTKPLDNGVSKADDGTLLPPILSLQDFQKWFVSIRKYNSKLSVNRTTIKVRK